MKLCFRITIAIAVLIMMTGCPLQNNQNELNRSQNIGPNQIHSQQDTQVLPEEKNNHTNEVTPKKRVKVAGIYVSPWVAGSKKMNAIMKLIESTDINTVVIDIKTDSGHLSYDSNVPLAEKIHSNRKPSITNITNLIDQLKSQKIYVIGRLVVFKDPFLAASRQEFAMRRKSGGLYKDNGVVWVDPYLEPVRQYNIDIAKEAVELGFDEIQFDYVRFPDDGKNVDQEVNFNNPDKLSKEDLIQQFLRDSRKQLHPLGAYVSADVFGLTTTTEDDMGIGQLWEKIAQEVDYISPMIYPSHYSKGMYGFANPDLNPYGVVKKAVADGLKKNQKLMKMNTTTEFSNQENEQQPQIAIIRPWLQSFTASWIHPHQKYGIKEVREQIRAAKEQGVDEYMLWNPHCEYFMNE
jgi:hypothetical protein